MDDSTRGLIVVISYFFFSRRPSKHIIMRAMHDGRRCLRWVLKKVPSPCAVLADPAKLSRRRSRLGLRMRLGASRTCRRPAPSGHPPGSQVRGRDALRTLFRAAPALGMAVVRRDHLLSAPQVHNQGLATSVSIMVEANGPKME